MQAPEPQRIAGQRGRVDDQPGEHGSDAEVSPTSASSVVIEHNGDGAMNRVGPGETVPKFAPYAERTLFCPSDPGN